MTYWLSTFLATAQISRLSSSHAWYFIGTDNNYNWNRHTHDAKIILASCVCIAIACLLQGLRYGYKKAEQKLKIRASALAVCNSYRCAKTRSSAIAKRTARRARPWLKIITKLISSSERSWILWQAQRCLPFCEMLKPWFKNIRQMAERRTFILFLSRPLRS